MSKPTRRAGAVVALISVLVGIALAAGGPAQAAPSPQADEHARIVRYWTPERVARATPREIVLDVRAPQAKPGGGGGGGGGSSAVTGSAWTGGGTVKTTTGKVLFTLGGVDYVCSGSVVADARADASLVLTAGHCVYDDAGNVFATNWMFVPDYETAKTFNCDVARFGCWTASALVTTTAWAASDFNEDYAFAVVGPGGKSGQALQLDATVGTQGIGFNLAHPRTVYAFGYPQAKPYNGQSLIYCAGTDTADVWGGSTDFGLECKMTGGSSGGPWFADFDAATGNGTLTSLNSFKYRGNPAYSKYMFGPYFDDYTQATYAAAQAAVANVLVVDPVAP